MQPVHFSFDEWLTDCEQSNRYTAPAAHEPRSEWTGHADFAEAMSMARNGWKEGRERMAHAVADIEAVGADREATTYDVAGNEPDIGRYLEGDPENMLAFLPTDERKVIRIVADIAASSKVDTSVIFTRGAAVCCLIDRLEAQGHRVELVIGASLRNRHSGRFTYFTVTVKAASQPLDVDRIAFTLAHAASLRRLAFATVEQRGVKDLSIEIPDALPEECRGDIWLPSARAYAEQSSQWDTPASAQAWINDQLCRFELNEAAQ